MKPEITLSNGNMFDLRNPEAMTGRYSIHTIAHALANLCRFTGHTREHYSVAQHSVLVSMLVPAEHALAGLLHDAHEAFVGDISKPLKSILPDFRAIEYRVQAAVLASFGIESIPECVHRADEQAMHLELRELVLHDSFPEGAIRPLSPAAAELLFLSHFDAIKRR